MKLRRERHLAPGPLTTRANALAIVAARNEATALLALNPSDEKALADAMLLRAWADETQRRTYALEPLVRPSGRTKAQLELSPGVRRVVSSYVNGEDKVQPGGAG